MADLADKLKALGVNLGASGLNSSPKYDPDRIETVLGARPHDTHLGTTYMVEEYLESNRTQGNLSLGAYHPLEAVARWARDERIASLSGSSFAFLDTETTGLSGGTGTYAFLIGVGRLEGDRFHLAQFFMHDPSGEPAQLAALEEFLAPCEAIVTYNGKSFDIPLLWNRFVTHGWEPPFRNIAHIDLLHLSRKLWRDRLDNRSLGSIEFHILGELRSDEDVPGWQIPQMYFDYLRSGDAQPLKRVFYHNAMDVVSLAALLRHSAALLANPLEADIEHGIDLLSIAKLYEDMGDIERAIEIYRHGLQHIDVLEARIPVDLLLQALMRLSIIHKRRGEYLQAIRLWEEAAAYRHIEAHIELAKYYEHETGEIDKARGWTQEAIELLRAPGSHHVARMRWKDELDHRLSRLERKASA